MSSPLKQNTTTIQELLNTINSLPEAGGVELPELSNPASAEEVFLNKEFIDEDGNSVTGTFSIDNELSNQDNLISQIQTALQNKAAATGEDVTAETNAYTSKLATLETAITALETELQGKASGGTSVETCTVVFRMSSGTTIQSYGALTYEGGIYRGVYSKSVDPLAPVTITNIVANSLFVVNFIALDPACRIVGNAELLTKDGHLCYFRIFASMGETVEIELYDND